jgi:CheY-like chemotaxis protein
VDDSAEMRRILRRLLEAQDNWRVCAEASDGTEAAAKFDENKFDAIVLDFQMPCGPQNFRPPLVVGKSARGHEKSLTCQTSLSDLTGKLCTKWNERESTGRKSRSCHQEVQTRADRDDAAAD